MSLSAWIKHFVGNFIVNVRLTKSTAVYFKKLIPRSKSADVFSNTVAGKSIPKCPIVIGMTVVPITANGSLSGPTNSSVFDLSIVSPQIDASSCEMQVDSAPLSITQLTGTELIVTSMVLELSGPGSDKAQMVCVFVRRVFMLTLPTCRVLR